MNNTETLPALFPYRTAWLMDAIDAADVDDYDERTVESAIAHAVYLVADSEGMYPDAENDYHWSTMLETSALEYLGLDYDELFPVTVD